MVTAFISTKKTHVLWLDHIVEQAELSVVDIDAVVQIRKKLVTALFDLVGLVECESEKIDLFVANSKSLKLLSEWGLDAVVEWIAKPQHESLQNTWPWSFPLLRRFGTEVQYFSQPQFDSNHFSGNLATFLHLKPWKHFVADVETWIGAGLVERDTDASRVGSCSETLICLERWTKKTILNNRLFEQRKAFSNEYFYIQVLRFSQI